MPSTDPHADEELLALFALGELRGTERDAVIRHLSECSECRQTAGAVMSWPALADSTETNHQVQLRTGWSRHRSIAWTGLAAAALMLLAFGTLVRLNIRVSPSDVTEAGAFAQASELLERGQFEKARETVVDATRRGITSDRLRSVEAEATRRIPGMVALASAGRLTDFGFEIGGVTARGAGQGQSVSQDEEALKILSESGSNDETIALNRGHALLSLRKPHEALAEFQNVVARSPNSSLARLGEGLARYALADYPAAESAFRASLRLEPELIAARINLAMALGEQGKVDDALAAWGDVLARPGALAAQDRRAIENEIEELRQARREAPTPSSPDRTKKDQ